MNEEARVLIWLLMEQDGGVLLARRKADALPMAGQWTLPGDLMRTEESSSETIWRVAKEMLDVQAIQESFVDTLYIKDMGLEYAINVFGLAFVGSPRFRDSGPYAEVRWVAPSALPKPMTDPLSILLTQDGGRPPRAAKQEGAS